MAIFKVARRDMPPQEKLKGIIIDKDATALRSKVTRLPISGGKEKAREGILLPETPIFLHGPGDSMQILIPSWRIRHWNLLVGLVLLFLLRRLSTLMPKSRLMHRALMPKDIE